MGGGMGAGVVCLLVAASLARADTVVPAPALPALEWRRSSLRSTLAGFVRS